MRITFARPARPAPEPPAEDLPPIDLSALGMSAEDLLLTDEEIAQLLCAQRRYRSRIARRTRGLS